MTGVGLLLAAALVTLRPGGTNGVYVAEEVPVVTLSVTGAQSSASLDITWRLCDYFGRTVRSSSETIALRQGVVLREYEFPSLERRGFFVMTLEWRVGGESGRAEASFVRLTSPPKPADPLFGISAFGDGSAELCRRLGAGTRAVGFSRADKLFRKAIARVRAFAAAGIRVEGHFNVLGEIYPEREESVYRIVSELKDVVRIWGAVGEIDLQMNLKEGNRDRYVEQVRLLSRAIRRADPTATFVALGCSGTDGQNRPDRYPVLRSILPEIRDAIDGLGIDQYTAGQTYGEGYETLDSERTELKEMMTEAWRIARENGLRTVSIEEKGPCIARSTPICSPLGSRMGDIVARDFVILKTLPFVAHWLYYRPFNWDKTAVIDWGMWEGRNPRHTVSAFASASRMLSGAKFEKSLDLNEQLPCHVFSKDGKRFAALWYNGKKPLDIALPTDVSVCALDLEGNPLPVVGGRLTIAGSPVWLFAEGGDPERMIRASRYDIPDPNAEVRRLAAAKDDAAYRVRRVKDWDGLAGCEEIVLEDPFLSAPGYADLKSHRLYNGIGDLSVRARFGHDGRRFLMEFRVRDDGHRNGNRPPRAFDGDCVQFAFDGAYDALERKLRGEAGFRDDDSMFVAALAKETPLVYCHVASAANRTRLENRPLAAPPEIVRDNAAGMTRYRLAIDFADLAPLDGTAGRAFGFSFCVFDRDPGEKALYRIEMTPGVAGIVDPFAYRKFVLD